MNLPRGGRHHLPVLALALLVGACGDSPTDPDGGGETDPADFDFTVDLIAFESVRSGNPDIFLITADGAAVVNVTNNPAPDGDPAWSPDGSRLAFASTRDGNTEIYAMNVDGSDVVRLTNDPAVDRFPAWSPDGSTIAFSSTRADGLFDIYLMDADGSNPRRLTTAAADDVEPSWLADGSRIIFCSTRSENADIWSMNPDGSGLVNLTDDPTSFNCAPAVTTAPADPGQICFVSDRAEGELSIYTMAADGSNQRRLTLDPADDFDASWRGDGGMLVFDSNRSGNWDLYLIEPAGTGLHRLTSHEADEWNPVWRP